jgi:hypothetical protein
MPLQNRVSPFGELFAAAARGTLMGNRGGRLHDADRMLGARRWASRQWICCVLDFHGRHREVWGNSYTELFFLDEATAFAVGHRPCFECRRKDAERFARLFSSDRPRESGDPRLDSRLRGNERRTSAAAMDDVLHRERLSGKEKRLHRAAFDDLPDAAFVVLDGEAFAVRGRQLLRWTPRGYRDARPRPRHSVAEVLTPPSILRVLKAGYAPLWHRSADKFTAARSAASPARPGSAAPRQRRR